MIISNISTVPICYKINSSLNASNAAGTGQLMYHYLCLYIFLLCCWPPVQSLNFIFCPRHCLPPFAAARTTLRKAVIVPAHWPDCLPCCPFGLQMDHFPHGPHLQLTEKEGQTRPLFFRHSERVTVCNKCELTSTTAKTSCCCLCDYKTKCHY